MGNPKQNTEAGSPQAERHLRIAESSNVATPLCRSRFRYYALARRVSYPFFDLRVVRLLLNVPSLPWCFEKGLLRIASRGQLPEKVRKRRKRLIVRDPILVRVDKPEWQLSDCFRPLKRLLEYVNTKPITKAEWLRQQE